MIDTFADNAAGRWRFFTDKVMGGVSSGALHFDNDGNRRWARMTGMVSTANNGGFIQMQRLLEPPLPSRLTCVRLIARGNDQRYFIHLRCTGALAPTAFYRAGFDVTSEWCETRLSFALFTAPNGEISALLEGPNLASVGVVAYGRNHHADICVSEIGCY